MSDCNGEFQKFLDNITVSSSKIESLKTSRDAIREKVRKYFKEEKKENSPKFYQQGSFALKTLVKPISGEIDLDDGVYLQNLKEKKNDWVKTETVHGWILKAVENHTNEIRDKKNCVRIVYANDYHVDLPIYGIEKNSNSEKYYVAKNGEEQWVISDPKEFKDWFYKKLNEEGEQLRNIIKYLKAWRDYTGLKKLTGIVITVLVVNNFQKKPDRDDESIYKTVEGILSALKNDKKVLNPNNDNEDLFRCNEDDKEKIINKLKNLFDNMKTALEEKEVVKSCENWALIFGDRFPVPEKQEKNDNSKLSITTPTKSWSK